MLCFTMICFCSMLLSGSKHCFLMLNSWHVNFTKSVTWNLLHFCHACLNLLFSELVVAQCSSFVKHLEWITAMCFVAMLECSSLFSLMHLDGHLLYITDRCHIQMAYRFQTVTPIPAFFISFSSDFISPFQWHTWISMLRPGSCISCHILHFASRIASRIAYRHFIILLGLARGWLYPCCLFVLLGRAGRRVRYRGARWVCLWGSSQLWQLCRQDDHTLEITTIFAMLVASFYRYVALPITCSSSLHKLPCQPLTFSPVLANRCLAMLPLLLSPSYSIVSCRWSWRLLHDGQDYVGISQYLLLN